MSRRPTDDAPDRLNPFAPPREDPEPDLAGPIVPPPDTPPGLAVSYRNTLGDFQDYARYYARHFTNSRWIRFGLLAAVGAFFAFSIARDVWSGKPWQVQAVTYGVGYLVLVAVMLLQPRWRGRKFRKAVRELPISTVVINPEGMIARGSEGSEVRRAWSAIPGVEATPKHIFLFETQDRGRVVTAHVIPRRAFARPDDADAFLQAAVRWKAEAEQRPASAPIEQDSDAESTGQSITFAYDDEDLRRVHRFYTAQNPAGGRRTPILLVGLLVIAVLTLLPLFLPARAGGPANVDSLQVISFAFPCIFFGSLILFMRRQRRFQTPAPDAPERRPLTIQIDPAGYRVVRDGRTEQVKTWKGLDGLAADADFLIIPRAILADKRRIVDAYLIPRRAFDSPEAAETFLRCARRWHAEANGIVGGPG